MFGRMRVAALTVLLGGSLVLVAVGTDPAAEAAKKPHKPAKPVVSSIAPRSGSTLGGTVVTIKGKHLKGASKVLFGKSKGTALKVRSDKKLTVTAPAHAAGLVDVVVKTKGGKSAKSSATRFTYALTKPAVTAVSPASGPTTGGTVVTVTGTGFVGVTAVQFDGVSGTAVSVASPTRLTVTSPAHLPQVTHIDVTNAAGTSPHKVADLFKFVAVPRSFVAPVPAGADANPRTLLADVTCPAGGSCTAVGYYFKAGPPAATRHPLVVRRTSDATWSATDPGVPADAAADPDAQLYDVACPTASFCAVVGSYRATDATYHPMVSTWNGSVWSAPQGIALPPLSNGATADAIRALDCPTATACYGVGSDYTGAVHQFLVLTLTGGTWTLTTQPPPAGVSPTIVAVSCGSATSCVAVGSGDPGGAEVPLTAVLSGGTWTSTSPMLPADTNIATPAAHLEAVSCTGPGACSAVGFYTTAAGNQFGLLEQQAATPAGWTPISFGGPAGAKAPNPGIALHAVACPSGNDCVGVGEFAAPDGTSRPLLAPTGGEGGGPTPAPLPPGATDDVLNDVTCLVVQACAAVGRHVAGSDLPLLEMESTAGWRAAVAPVPAGWVNGELSVVAGDDRVAVAVGRYGDSSGHTQGVITVDIPLT